MWLFLVHFEGLVVGVVEEDEAFARRRVGPDILVGNAHAVQFSDLRLDVVDLKGQMAQSGSLGIGQALRRRGIGEQFDDIVAIQRQFGQVGLLFLAPMLSHDLAADDAGIEIEAPLIVGANDGNMVYFVEL